ncbi:hypothetical protein TVAG_272490 [Trichomonas vaginalis G3]|uniref:Alpha glucuronidase N-terminal domain-containing protein n=1 Tax=Trichomonas vaginalis (strain ATCC PRA-98 / G3) TaxID=412133 RepID=A2FDW5_TRIV3|nr:coagulation factor 5/8 C-terminal domain-containing protein family [Trichomonas vaginalis G3]EAX96921.1 hypothetical protein TVAG_272490 [Trichomonas vaginalis G3]KAI5511117.1 coagulation factor 5/8 C-terminal domain-containing protein family [Trichomonas vaginalis G3]|eukprot:XP_001309851.1 hypothetical protein [Trichomonas vaginalis G3]
MLAFFLLSISVSKDIIIADKEKSYFKCMYPAQSDKNPDVWRYFHGCDEIAKGIRKITGSKMDIITDASNEMQNLILVGPTKLSPKNQYTPTVRGTDFFEIRFHNGNLAILGNWYGFLYGCFEILEKYGGVRYYASWMYVYPPADSFKVPDDVNIISKSPFLYREFWSSDFTYTDFNEKSRANVWLPNYYDCESFAYLMKSDKYPLSQYPTRFADLGNGQRSTWVPCLSDDLTFEIFMDKILTDLRKREVYLVDVSQSDTGEHCLCERCMAKYHQYGDRYSGVNLWFINKIATALESEFPNVLVRTFAWGFTLDAPANIKAHKNVIIRITPIMNDYGHPFDGNFTDENRHLMKELDKWKQVANHFYVWEYSTNFIHIMSFHPNYHTIAANMKMYARYGFEGVGSQDANFVFVDSTGRFIPRFHSDMQEYKAYLTLKLLWDPDQDADYLVNDFLNGFYGPSAAPYVKQILDDTKDLMFNDYKSFVTLTHHDARLWFIPQEFIDHIKNLWDLAIKASELDRKIDPRYVYNTKMGQLSSLYTQFMIYKDQTVKPYIKDGKVYIGGNEKLTYAAKTMMERCPGPFVINETSKGACAFTYNTAADAPLRTLIKQYSEGVAVDIIKSGDFTAISAPKSVIDGKIISLKKGNTEFLHSEEGIYFGYFTNTAGIFTQYSYDYRLKGKTDSTVTYTVTSSDKSYSTTKKYTATTEGVNFDVHYTRNVAGSNMRPVMMVTLNINDGTFVGYKIGNKEWKSKQLMNNMEFDHCGGTLDGVGQVSVIDPTSRKGVDIKVPDYFESVVIHINRTSQKIRLSFVGPYVTPPQGYSVDHHFEIHPIEKNIKAPSFTKSFDYTTHDPKIKYGLAKGDKFVFPDFMMKYENYGAERVSVADPLSSTGLSVRLGHTIWPTIYFNPQNVYPYYFFKEGVYRANFTVKCVNPKLTDFQYAVYGYSHPYDSNYDGWYMPPKDFGDNEYKVIVVPKATMVNHRVEFVVTNKPDCCDYIHLSEFSFIVEKPPTQDSVKSWPEQSLNRIKSANHTDLNKSEKSKKWIPAVITVCAIVVIAAIVVGVIFIVKKKKSDGSNDVEERNESQMSIA